MPKNLTHNASFMLTNEDLESAVYALRELQKSAQVEASQVTCKEESKMLVYLATGWREIADRMEATAERRFDASVKVNQQN
jgi:predicted MarR family transcription regulator